MPSFSVNQSIEINAPQESVTKVLTDYNQWPVWSPWLCAEPQCQLENVGRANTVGHGYNWQGDVVGSGEMRLEKINHHQLDMHLQFLKPWKSTAEVRFKLQPVNANHTLVAWQMESQLPFFMFFMKSTFVSMLGSDYRRGLLMLKDYVETGQVPSSSEILGVSDRQGIAYAGIAGNTSIAEIGQAFKGHVPAIEALTASNEHAATASYMAVYNRMDIKTQRCDYIFGVATPQPVAASALHDNADLKISSIKGGRSFTVLHKGSHRHLGNGWATSMMHVRAKKLKQDKQTPPFERYLNHPDSTPEAELLTEIHIPIK